MRPRPSAIGCALAAAPVARGVLAAALAALLALPAAAPAQTDGADGDRARAADAEAADAARWRFPVGERATYDVTFGRVRVGEGSLTVEAADTVRGRPVYRVAFEIRGGPFFYKVDDRSVSWIAPDPIRSLRFQQNLREGSYRRDRRYELDQEAGTYTRMDWDEEAETWSAHPERRDLPMPRAALDEIAYLYLTRALPLQPGRTLRFERYFEEDGNPVVLEVLRREEVRVPAGRFRTVVVRPIIQTDGIFGEGGEAEVYLSDDDRRVIVQLRSRMTIGQLNMYLKSYEPGRADG